MTPSPIAPPPSSVPLPDLLPAGWSAPGAPPLEIDVGCHKGRFLVEMARMFPTRHFLGIERQKERVERTRRKIAALGQENAAVVCGEGLETLRAAPASSVAVIHVLFPDPWPKRRHHSRRLVQTRFLDCCRTLLQPGGLLRLVTDDAPYARAMEAAISTAGGFEPVEHPDRDYPLTEFQSKFLAEGRPTYTFLLRRTE